MQLRLVVYFSERRAMDSLLSLLTVISSALALLLYGALFFMGVLDNEF